MSELETPYRVNGEDDHIRCITHVIDVNNIWAFDCYTVDADEIIKRVNGYVDLEQQLDKANKASNEMYEALEESNKATKDLEQQVQHWKSNHDNMAQKNAVLSQRPDLPADRLPAIEKYEQELDEAKTDEFKKGFWFGFERAKMHPDSHDIQSHYIDVENLKANNLRNQASDK